MASVSVTRSAWRSRPRLRVRRRRTDAVPRRRRSTDVQIDLAEATPAEKPLLGNLLELYQYDFTEYTGDDVGAARPLRLPLPRRLLRSSPAVTPSSIQRRRPARRLRLVRRARSARRRWRPSSTWRSSSSCGSTAATASAPRPRVAPSTPSPADGRCARLAANPPAQAFWRNVIADYTAGRFDERRIDDGRRLMQSFDNTSRSG